MGYDPREDDTFDLCVWSILRHASEPLDIRAIRLTDLVRDGLYTRKTERRDNQLWDVVSDAPMSTEFAISRFFVPQLADNYGWAVFMDCDMIVTRDIVQVFHLADPSKALMCVQHRHTPTETTKMDDQRQTAYQRKNWSSFVLWNCNHPAHAALTPEYLNRTPGRHLHRFSWLSEADIGALPLTWNFLVGYNERIGEPANLHFTLGTPDMEGHENTPFADRWIRESEFLTAWKRRK